MVIYAKYHERYHVRLWYPSIRVWPSKIRFARLIRSRALNTSPSPSGILKKEDRWCAANVHISSIARTNAPWQFSVWQPPSWLATAASFNKEANRAGVQVAVRARDIAPYSRIRCTSTWLKRPRYHNRPGSRCILKSGKPTPKHGHHRFAV